MYLTGTSFEKRTDHTSFHQHTENEHNCNRNEYCKNKRNFTSNINSECNVSAQHEYLALHKAHQSGSAVNQAISKADQRIDTANGYSPDQQLQKHKLTPLFLVSSGQLRLSNRPLYSFPIVYSASQYLPSSILKIRITSIPSPLPPL